MKLQNHVSRMIVYYERLILQYPGHKVIIENTMSETEKDLGDYKKMVTDCMIDSVEHFKDENLARRPTDQHPAPYDG